MPAEISSEHDNHRFNNRNSDHGGIFFRQRISNHGEVANLDLNDRKSDLPAAKPELIPPPSESNEYKLQQDAYLSKMRKMLTPRPLSDGLKEFDSTKDNPPNSHSARFGIKPDPEVYKYRLVSWGEAGSGIPLVNKDYSARHENTPGVDEGLKRKKFSNEQRETVRNAAYKNVIIDKLKVGLHNSHGLASRFWGPETNGNISPATFTKYKGKQWGQGEMQSHFENALFRIESKASRYDITIFLRCTDYLGKFGELQSRKIKVFLSESVTDKEILASSGNVKETILGTFYFPGMLKEPESGAIISDFKNQVKRLEQAVDLVVKGDPGGVVSRAPLEMRYRYGFCAQDLKPVGQQKLVHGKIHRTNDGLSTVLQFSPKIGFTEDLAQGAQKHAVLSFRSQSSNEVFDAIDKLNANPRVLRRGEEIWKMHEVEAVLGHIRRTDLDDHIQAQFDAGQLSLEDVSNFHSLDFSRSSTESSNSSLETTSSDVAKSTERTVDVEFDNAQDLSRSRDAVASGARCSGLTNLPTGSDSVGGLASESAWTPLWLEETSGKKRRRPL